MRSLNTRRRAQAAPFHQTAGGRPRSCLGNTGQGAPHPSLPPAAWIPPSAVPTQACPALLQAQGCLLFPARSSLSTFSMPAASLVFPPHPSPGREWGQGGEGGQLAAGAVSWYLSSALHGSALWVAAAKVSLLLFHPLLSFFFLWPPPLYHFY